MTYRVRLFDLVAAILVVAGVAFILLHRSNGKAHVSAPNFVMATTRGPVRIGAGQHRIVVLDFWASWCPPCRASVPLVRATTEHFPGVVLVDVDEGDPEYVALRYGRQFHAGTIAFDRDMSLGAKFAASGLPLLVLIDAQGRVVRRWSGFDPGIAADLAAALSAVGARSAGGSGAPPRS